MERVTEKMNDSIMIYVIAEKDYVSDFLNLGTEFIASDYGDGECNEGGESAKCECIISSSIID